MTKFKDTKELFEFFEKLDPLSVFETEHGFLKLTDQQKDIIAEKVFTPGKHIFAFINLESENIQCAEVTMEHPSAFDKFIDKHEKSLAYAYLGESDRDGK